MPQHSSRRRAVHLTLAVGFGSLLACSSALPATAASRDVVATAPAGATTLWIDFEGSSDSDTIAAQVQTADASTELEVRRTTLGATGITPVTPGEVTIAVSTDGDTLPTVSLTFADADGTVLLSSTQVLDESTGGEEPVEETPGTENPGSEDPGSETPGAETPGSESPAAGTPATPLPQEEQAAKDKQLSVTGASVGMAGLIALLATGGGLILHRVGLNRSKAAQR